MYYDIFMLYYSQKMTHSFFNTGFQPLVIHFTVRSVGLAKVDL